MSSVGDQISMEVRIQNLEVDNARIQAELEASKIECEKYRVLARKVVKFAGGKGIFITNILKPVKDKIDLSRIVSRAKALLGE